MAWIETSKGNFINLNTVFHMAAREVAPLYVSAHEVGPLEHEPTSTWVVEAYVVTGQGTGTTELAGNWTSREAAQAWMRGVLLGAGEKIAGHVVIR